MKLFPLFILFIFVHNKAFNQKHNRIDLEAGINIFHLPNDAGWLQTVESTPFPSFYFSANRHIAKNEKKFVNVGVSYSCIAMNYKAYSKGWSEKGYLRANFLKVQFTPIGLYSRNEYNEFGINFELGFNLGEKARNEGSSTKVGPGIYYNEKYYNESNLYISYIWDISPYYQFGHIDFLNGYLSFRTALLFGKGPYFRHSGISTGIKYHIVGKVKT